MDFKQWGNCINGTNTFPVTFSTFCRITTSNDYSDEWKWNQITSKNLKAFSYKKQNKINEIMAENDTQIADIKDAMLVAVLTNDTELQEELKQEYAAVIEDTNNKLKEVNVND